MTDAKFNAMKQNRTLAAPSAAAASPSLDHRIDIRDNVPSDSLHRTKLPVIPKIRTWFDSCCRAKARPVASRQPSGERKDRPQPQALRDSGLANRGAVRSGSSRSNQSDTIQMAPHRVFAVSFVWLQILLVLSCFVIVGLGVWYLNYSSGLESIRSISDDFRTSVVRTAHSHVSSFVRTYVFGLNSLTERAKASAFVNASSLGFNDSLALNLIETMAFHASNPVLQMTTAAMIANSNELLLTAMYLSNSSTDQLAFGRSDPSGYSSQFGSFNSTLGHIELSGSPLPGNSSPVSPSSLLWHQAARSAAYQPVWTSGDGFLLDESHVPGDHNRSYLLVSQESRGLEGAPSITGALYVPTVNFNAYLQLLPATAYAKAYVTDSRGALLGVSSLDSNRESALESVWEGLRARGSIDRLLSWAEYLPAYASFSSLAPDGGNLWTLQRPPLTIVVEGFESDEFYVDASAIAGPGLQEPWFIIMATPKSHYLQAIQSGLLKTGVFTAVVVFLASVLAFMVARGITQPVLKSIRLMELAGQGKWEEVEAELRDANGSCVFEEIPSPTGSGRSLFSRGGSDDRLTGAGMAGRRSPSSRARSAGEAPRGCQRAPAPLVRGAGRSLHAAFSRLFRCVAALRVKEAMVLQRSFVSMAVSLQRTEQELRKANEGKKQFLRYIFHEVRVPFNAIVLGVQELQQQIDSELMELDDPSNQLTVRLSGSHYPLPPTVSARVSAATTASSAPAWTPLQSLQSESRALRGATIDSFGTSMSTDSSSRHSDAPRAKLNEVLQRQRETLQIVADSSQVVSKILDDVLSLSKIESGKLKLEVQSFSLPTLVHQTVYTFQDVARQNNVDLRVVNVNVRDTMPSSQLRLRTHTELQRRLVLGDPFRLRQVLSNFISNAIKFSPAGSRVDVNIECLGVCTQEHLATLYNSEPVVRILSDAGSHRSPSQSRTSSGRSHRRASMNSLPRSGLSSPGSGSLLSSSGHSRVSKADSADPLLSHAPPVTSSPPAEEEDPSPPRSSSKDKLLKAGAKEADAVRCGQQACCWPFGSLSADPSGPECVPRDPARAEDSSQHYHRVDTLSSLPSAYNSLRASDVNGDLGARIEEASTLEESETEAVESKQAPSQSSTHRRARHRDSCQCFWCKEVRAGREGGRSPPHDKDFEQLSVTSAIYGSLAEEKRSEPASRSATISVRDVAHINRDTVFIELADCGGPRSQVPGPAKSLEPSVSVGPSASTGDSKPRSLPDTLRSRAGLEGLTQAERLPVSAGKQFESGSLRRTTSAPSTPPVARRTVDRSKRGSNSSMSVKSESSSSSSPSSLTDSPTRKYARFRVSVKDKGVGIKEEDQQLLFKPYVQILAGELQKGKGTGLGLSIAKSIVTLAGGVIGVTSRPGAGSEFFFEIPFEISSGRAGKRSRFNSGDSAQAASISPRLSPSRSPSPVNSPNRGDFTMPLLKHSISSPPSLPAESSVSCDVAPVSTLSLEGSSRPTETGTGTTGGMAGTIALLPPSLSSEGGTATSDSPIISYSNISTSESPANSIESDGSSPVQPLSIAEALPISSRARKQSDSPKQLPPPSPSRPLVLVVEDSVPNAKLVMRVLERYGCVAEHVENGQIAVDRCTTAATAQSDQSTRRPTHLPYDLILMDGSMPTKDGYTATREIVAAGVRSPIVALTGNALEEDQAAFLRAGAVAVLTKPIQLPKLLEVMQCYLPTEVAARLTLPGETRKHR